MNYFKMSNLQMKEEFYRLLEETIINLNPKFRDKYRMTPELYDLSVACCKSRKQSRVENCDGHFKSWARRQFEVVHENCLILKTTKKPVVKFDDIFERISECHEETGHSLLKKTWEKVC